MTDDRPRIAVSGASGYIGSLLVRRFEDEGASVVALGRSRGRAGSAQRHYDMAEPPPRTCSPASMCSSTVDGTCRWSIGTRHGR